jgi:tetratricopeptide (TPR) repeat protein
MDTKYSNSNDQDLIDQLQRLPLKEVPADLTDSIMARVSTPKPSRMSTFWMFIARSYSISFRPVYAFGIALLVCGAFFLGQNSRQVPVQIVQTSVPVPQLQAETLENPESAYLVGRGLLRASNSEGQALTFLQRASLLEPENPEFAYWEGVGHWSNGDKEQERRSYLRGLDADPESVPLLINLGHNYLGDKNYREALGAYQAVLTLSPNEAVALYNSGLIYRALGMIPEEISSWRSFLQENREGTKSFRAVQRLNDYDDFTFRTYQVGGRKVILNQQTLLDESLPESKQQEELANITTILEQNERLNLEVVIFVENDKEAARKRAFHLKRMISKNSNTDVKTQVRLSWFDAPETIKRDDTESGVELSEGLLLFSRLITEKEKEVSI